MSLTIDRIDAKLFAKKMCIRHIWLVYALRNEEEQEYLTEQVARLTNEIAELQKEKERGA